MNWLKRLYTEQTTADETVVFLLLGTLVTLFIAFVIYALVLSMLARWRMPQPLPLSTLLFPSKKRMRKYAAEYLMGTLTALLLTLTVTAKHYAVEAILEQNIGDLGHSLVSSALPFGNPSQDDLTALGVGSQSAKQVAAWLSDGAAEAISIEAEDLVRPLLTKGMKESANTWVRNLVAEIEPEFIYSNTLKIILLIAAASLLFVYGVWFAYQRYKGLKSNKASEPDYTNIVKRLSLPAVCIPLLLVSAAALDEKRIADSAVAVIDAERIIDLDEKKNFEPPLFTKLISQQIDDARSGTRSSDAREFKSSLEQLSRRMDSTTARFDLLESKLGNTNGRVDVLDRNAVALSGSVNALANKIDEVGRGMNSLVSKVSTNETDIKSQAEEIAALNADSKLLGNSINAFDDVLDRLGEEVAGMSSTLKQNVNDTERALSQVSNTQRRVGIIDEKIKNLQRVFDEYKKHDHGVNNDQRRIALIDRKLGVLRQEFDGYKKHTHARIVGQNRVGILGSEPLRNNKN